MNLAGMNLSQDLQNNVFLDADGSCMLVSVNFMTPAISMMLLALTMNY